jgi:hypothetical protein
MLTETLLRIPFAVIGRCSLVPTSHWLQGNARELTCHRRLSVLLIYFTESKAAFCKHLLCVQIAAIGFLKRVTGKHFQNQ